MTNGFQRINIAVKVPQDISQAVIQLSGEIGAGHQTYFVLDGINFIPHITLYSPEYPSHNIDEVLARVDHIIKDNATFTAHFEDARSHLGYIDLTFEKTKAWTDLHERIVNELNLLRENHLREKYLDSDELKQYSDQQQKYIQKYGSPEVMDSFTPHLTLSRLKDETIAKKVVASLALPIGEFPVGTIAAFSMGEHGTCNGILKEWSMKDF